MVLSMKDRRIHAIEKHGVRSEVPCMRCLAACANGDIASGFQGCRMDPNSVLWTSMLQEGKQAKRCDKCLRAGQDCVAPPRAVLPALRILEPLMVSALADGISSANDRDAAANAAGDVLAVVQESFKPYHEHLTLHSGATGLEDEFQSGIHPVGRDRSKAAVIKRENAKKRAMEEDSDLETYNSPRKRKFGMGAVGLTEVEQDKKDAADAAQAAEKARKTAAAKKKAPAAAPVPRRRRRSPAE